MHRVALGGILGLFVATFAASQDTTDKRELRYKFEKGEKLTLTLKQKMNVKLDEVPEAFQGIAPEEPFDTAFDGEADFEVKAVADNGTATLEGRFQKMKAKGSALGQEVDFAYDRAKDGDDPQGDDEGDDGMGPMGGNPEAMLRQVVKATIKLEIDGLGRIKTSGAGGGGMAAQLLDLGGLIGMLPKDKVGPGDSWKNTDSLTLPGLPLKMRVKSENKFEKCEKLDERECAVIQSKFTVGTEDGDAKKEGGEDPDESFSLPIQAKFVGDGKGTMHFAIEAGRPLKNEINLNVKLTVTVGNPQGGDDIEIKGTFKMEQGLGIRKKD